MGESARRVVPRRCDLGVTRCPLMVIQVTRELRPPYPWPAGVAQMHLRHP